MALNEIVLKLTNIPSDQTNNLGKAIRQGRTRFLIATNSNSNKVRSYEVTETLQ